VDGQPTPDEPWAHWLGHLLWEVSARTSALGEAALTATPLTLPSIGLLDQVATQPGITIAEIARRSPKSQQAISQVAARLEKLGFLERRLANSRGIALHITASGARARAQGNAIERAFETQLEDALGSDRYDRLRHLLEEMRTIVLELDQDRQPAR
jgi:DNA-binding MarR family transcriptional regulator